MENKQWKDKGGTAVFPLRKKYDVAVVIGRMEGVTFGHTHLFKEANKLADRVLILCGSRNRAPSIKNPWCLAHRKIMISEAILECIPELYPNYKVLGIDDFIYNNQHWAKKVGALVDAEIPLNSKVCLVGHDKDETSFYLNMFPQWKLIKVGNYKGINATELRESYFEDTMDEFEEYMHDMVPSRVIEFLKEWKTTNRFQNLFEEFNFIETYKESWEGLPYPVAFNTVDSIVIESGHVLMIKRGGHPGKGTWALPGGFLDAGSGERLREAARRELVEETKIDVPPAMLLDLYNKAEFDMFDHPSRDLRGRIITAGFLIQLPSRPGGLSKVKGSDDAVAAKWIPMYEIEKMSEAGQIFSDHADIIFNLTARAKI